MNIYFFFFFDHHLLCLLIFFFKHNKILTRKQQVLHKCFFFLLFCCCCRVLRRLVLQRIWRWSGGIDQSQIDCENHEMTAAQILLKLWLFCKIFIHISSQCELTAVVTDQLVSGPLRWTQSQSVFSGLPGGLSQSLCSPDLQVSRRSFRLLICSNLLKVVVPTHWQSVFVSMVSRNKVSVFKLTAD